MSEGDYFYAIVSGKCLVTRETPLNRGGLKLAELTIGDTFGEEALISEAKRNATVTMLTDGVLMRLNKKDFRELMNEPLVQWVDYPKAREIIARGGHWLDVRLPSEHQNLAIEGSLNVPLYFIRLKISTLDRSRPIRASIATPGGAAPLRHSSWWNAASMPTYCVAGWMPPKAP